MKKVSRAFLGMTALVAFLGIGAAYNAGHVVYNYAIPSAVSDSLMKEYETAVRKNTDLIRRNELMQKRDSENKSIIKSINTLTAIKPAEIKFTKIEVLENSSIHIDGYGPDASVFNIFAEQIRQEKKYFLNAQLDKLTATNAGSYKTFTIKATEK